MIAGNEGSPERRSTDDETMTGFCSLCARTAYVRNGRDFVCPVCSSPLFEAQQAKEVEPR